MGGGIRRIENGTTGTVIAVDTARNVVTVRTREHQPRDLKVGYDRSPLLDLHYAVHVYKAQGATVDRGYAVVGGWQTDREKLYVACSRARHGTHLFVDAETLGAVADKNAVRALGARAGRSRAKQAALTSSDGRWPTHRCRTRRTLTSGEPLTAVWKRRGRRREAARARADDELRAQARQRRRSRVSQLRARAFVHDVPVWVVHAAEQVTGRRFGIG